MAKKQSQALVSTASIVDGKIILSLPDAYTPVVWQMDLQEAKSSALEVKEDTKSNRFTLSLKNQKGEGIDIASYEDRSAAVNALMAASQALESGHGKIRPQVIQAVNPNNAANYGNFSSPAPQLQNSKDNKAGAVLATLMIIVLVLAWTFSIPKSSETVLRSARTSPAATGETGVPVSADDFLSRQ